MDIKTNKLNIYLIKDSFTDEDSITKINTDSEISKVEIKGVGHFYYKESSKNQPDWITSFFRNNQSIDSNKFFNSSSKTVLIVRIRHKRRNRFFALTFGFGRILLLDSCFENRFGLITSLNILEHKSIRSIDKRTMSSNPKISKEQITKLGDANDFQIDFEKDLLLSITGKSLDQDFGNTVSGKESFSISAKLDITNIKPFLSRCLTVYDKNNYKKNFKWIDQIKDIQNKVLIDKLNDKLIGKLNRRDELIWLAVPDLIDWKDFKGFKYSQRKSDNLYEELNIQTFLEQAFSNETISVDNLKNTMISSWSVSSDECLYKWNSYSCLYAEINYERKKYILNNSKWYVINEDFVSQVNKEVDEIRMINLHLPDYNHLSEGHYNIYAAASKRALCLDAKNLSYGGGYSKIEFCDILTKDKELIHVKKYCGSATLSHLFAQGFVSAELLLTDNVFRNNVINKLLTRGFKTVIPITQPKASDYKVIYAIITNKEGKLSIPFFSKVVLKNYKKLLIAYGFKVYLCKIKNIKQIDNDD